MSILESAVKSVYDRMAENQTVVLAFGVLRSTIELAKNSSRVEWPRTKPFLDPHTVEAFRALVEETEQWLAHALNVTRKQEPWKGFDIGVDQCHIQTARLFDASQEIEATEEANGVKGPKDARAESDERGWRGNAERADCRGALAMSTSR
jgi:hypothetical protein